MILNPATGLILGKCLVGCTVLIAVLSFLLRRRRGALRARLARLPLMRSMLLAGIAVAVGVGAFDVCAEHHVVVTEAGGTCSCWLTGVLAGMGALIAGMLGLAGRALVAFTRKIVRFVIALFFILESTFERLRDGCPRAHVARMPGGARWARRLAGRPPPL